MIELTISLPCTRFASRSVQIFVDILERINVLFSPNGYVLNSSVDGCIQMKSYLAGNPELRLALNEDLVVGSLGGGPSGGGGQGGEFGSVVLDDCNFNDCCNLSEFGPSRCVVISKAGKACRASEAFEHSQGQPQSIFKHPVWDTHQVNW